MPYVKRDDRGQIIAVSQDAVPGFDEHLPVGDIGLAEFLRGVGGEGAKLEATDLDFIRVLEDVVDLLIDKGVILFTELPATAQDKILHRQRLRSQLGGRLDLIGDE